MFLDMINVVEKIF